MANKNARAFSDKKLDSASGGFVYQNNQNHRWEICDRNGNYIDVFFSKKRAQEAARSMGFEDDVVNESELKNYRASMIKNGYADINGKRYYRFL